MHEEPSGNATVIIYGPDRLNNECCSDELQHQTRMPLEKVVIAQTPDELLAKVVELSPGLLVMKIGNDMEVLKHVKWIKTISPRTRIILHIGSVSRERLADILHTGVEGVLGPQASREQLFDAISETVFAHLRYIDEHLASRSELAELAYIGLPNLTDRETDVLELLALGSSNQEIADALTVTTETAKSHISNILTKLHVETRQKATAYAFAHNLVAVDLLLQPGGHPAARIFQKTTQALTLRGHLPAAAC